jgi:hypothetical protein
MASGLKNQEIADKLYLSIHTVEYNATRIYSKLGVRNRTEAGMVAIRLGLLGTADRSEHAPKALSDDEDLRESKMRRNDKLTNLMSSHAHRRRDMLNDIRALIPKPTLRRGAMLALALLTVIAAVYGATRFSRPVGLEGERWSVAMRQEMMEGVGISSDDPVFERLRLIELGPAASESDWQDLRRKTTFYQLQPGP